jgi:hypothetical protein
MLKTKTTCFAAPLRRGWPGGHGGGEGAGEPRRRAQGHGGGWFAQARHLTRGFLFVKRRRASSKAFSRRPSSFNYSEYQTAAEREAVCRRYPRYKPDKSGAYISTNVATYLYFLVILSTLKLQLCVCAATPRRCCRTSGRSGASSTCGSSTSSSRTRWRRSGSRRRSPLATKESGGELTVVKTHFYKDKGNGSRATAELCRRNAPQKMTNFVVTNRRSNRWSKSRCCHPDESKKQQNRKPLVFIITILSHADASSLISQTPRESHVPPLRNAV